MTEEAHPQRDLRPGDRLDRHELVCVLAQGGMGAIWLARMRGIHGVERLVALKTILPAYSADEKFRAMFLDEARIASRIHHENVIGIVDIGEASGQLYFAMEYVEGFTLKHVHKVVRAALGGFPLAIALRIVAEACAGLHAAHELRDDDGSLLEVVHRDASPQNLLLTPRGNVKVIDFGVARARDRLMQATEAGTLKGKVHYMAPEQARGGALDRRADVYGMGAVLHLLVTGSQVHETADGGQLEVLKNLMLGVPPKPIPESVPTPIARLIERAISPDPALRFATMSEMLAAIEQAAAETGLVASADDVGRLVERHLGAALAERRAAIQQSVANAKRKEREIPRLGDDAGVVLAETRVQAIPVPHPSSSAGATFTAVGTNVLLIEAPAQPRSRAKVLFGGAAAVVTLGVLVASVASAAVAYGRRTAPVTPAAVQSPKETPPEAIPSVPAAALVALPAAPPTSLAASAPAVASAAPTSSTSSTSTSSAAKHAESKPATTKPVAKSAKRDGSRPGSKSEFLDDGF